MGSKSKVGPAAPRIQNQTSFRLRIKTFYPGRSFESKNTFLPSFLIPVLFLLQVLYHLFFVDLVAFVFRGTRPSVPASVFALDVEPGSVGLTGL